MRLKLNLLVALIYLGLVGCSFGEPPATPTPIPTPTPLPTPTRVPDTKYANMRFGVTAILPGNKWIQGGQSEAARDVEMDILHVDTPGKHLFFLVSLTNGLGDVSIIGNDKVLAMFASSLTKGFEQPVQVIDDKFNGRWAKRAEGISKEMQPPDSYHVIEYFLLNRGDLYMVGAGSLASEWEATGKQDVYSILKSVGID